VSNGSRFKKAQSEQAYLKAALYGKAGSGKTLTSLLWAEGLAAVSGGRIAYVDTERGSEFYSMAIPERTVHPKAFDFDRLITTSLLETLEAVEELDAEKHRVVVIDSLTHLWEAARNTYRGQKTSTGGIPIQAWGEIKRPYKRLISLLLDGNFHVIICGREGVVMEEDESGDVKVTGARMKAEGETPHEPHVLGRMWPERHKDGVSTIRVFFEKDRSGILAGKTFPWPNYKTIEPLMSYLSGGTQGRIGTPEDSAEKDAAKADERDARAESERAALYAQILSAIQQSSSVDALKAAWSLVNGKKTKLGDYVTKLEAAKEARKAELMKMAEVA
jgi:hypothetical protein